MKAIIIGEKKGKAEVIDCGKTSDMQNEINKLKLLSKLPKGYEYIKLIVLAKGVIKQLSAKQIELRESKKQEKEKQEKEKQEKDPPKKSKAKSQD